MSTVTIYQLIQNDITTINAFDQWFNYHARKWMLFTSTIIGRSYKSIKHKYPVIRRKIEIEKETINTDKFSNAKIIYKEINPVTI